MLDLLVEKGYTGVTVEGVAAAAGVAKQTVYRWWNSKTDILLERAIERGELPAGLDLDVEVDRLVGPVHHRVPVTGDPVDEAFTDRLVEGFLRGQ